MTTQPGHPGCVTPASSPSKQRPMLAIEGDGTDIYQKQYGVFRAPCRPQGISWAWRVRLCASQVYHKSLPKLGESFPDTQTPLAA